MDVEDGKLKLDILYREYVGNDGSEKKESAISMIDVTKEVGSSANQYENVGQSNLSLSTTKYVADVLCVPWSENMHTERLTSITQSAEFFTAYTVGTTRHGGRIAWRSVSLKEQELGSTEAIFDFYGMNGESASTEKIGTVKMSYVKLPDGEIEVETAEWESVVPTQLE